jgi:hypothetical protein
MRPFSAVHEQFWQCLPIVVLLVAAIGTTVFVASRSGRPAPPPVFGRVERLGGLQTEEGTVPLAFVRLPQGQRLRVRLPNRHRCAPGSRIELIASGWLFRPRYRAGIWPCRPAD